MKKNGPLNDAPDLVSRCLCFFRYFFSLAHFCLEKTKHENETARNVTKQGCLDDARALLDAYNDDNLPRSCSRSGINMDDMNDSHDGQPSDSTKRSSSCTSGVSRMSSIDLVEGEFLEQDWGNPSVICMSSACFDEKIMADIAMRCREQLLTYERNTRVVVTLDKPLPKVMMLELENDQKEVRGVSQAAFEVVWQCQVEGCWGGAVVAYVHERVSKVIGG